MTALLVGVLLVGVRMLGILVLNRCRIWIMVRVSCRVWTGPSRQLMVVTLKVLMVRELQVAIKIIGGGVAKWLTTWVSVNLLTLGTWTLTNIVLMLLVRNNLSVVAVASVAWIRVTLGALLRRHVSLVSVGGLLLIVIMTRLLPPTGYCSRESWDVYCDSGFGYGGGPDDKITSAIECSM